MFAAADFAGSDRASEISFEISISHGTAGPSVRTRAVAVVCDNLCDQLGVQTSTAASSLSVCCTTSLRDRGLCATVGDVIVRPSSGARVLASAVVAAGTAARLNGTTTVVSTGVKAFAFALCPMDASSSVATRFPGSGVVTFRNPYGFLPARMFGYMVVYPVLGGLYFLLLLAFLAAFLVHRRSRTSLQPGLALMLSWGMLESFIAFAAFASANETGAPLCCPPSGLVAAWTVLSVGKHAAVFAALLAVSHGYGVTTLTMPGRYKGTIAFLFATYFAFNAWNDLDALSPTPARFASSLAAIGAVLTTVATLLIIGFWLNTTVARLEHERQTVKLGVYRRLRQLLLLFAAVLFVCTVFASLVRSGAVAMPWQAFFVVDAWFPVSFFVLLSGVALIWWPSASASQLAVSHQIPLSDGRDVDDDDDSGAEDGGSRGGNGGPLAHGDGIRRVDMAHVELPTRRGPHPPSRAARTVFSVDDDEDEEAGASESDAVAPSPMESADDAADFAGARHDGRDDAGGNEGEEGVRA